jgi:hypothetical protein
VNHLGAVVEAGAGFSNLEQFRFRQGGFRKPAIEANEKLGEYEDGRLIQTLHARKMEANLSA